MTPRERLVLRLAWALALLAAIGPIWTVERDIWDGVIGAYGLQRQMYAGIHDWLVPGNWGLMYLIFRAVGGLSELLPVAPWVGVKLLLTASVIGIAHETRRLGAGLLRWDERASRAAGVLALAFPCWYLLYGSTFVYVVFIWWVFLGHRWLHGPSRLRAVAGYLLLLASFQVNSNFVMVFALEAARWVCRDRARAWNWPRTALVLGSAVVVYLVLRLAFPPQGLYQGYNNLILPFSLAGLKAWLRAALMFGTWLPLVAAAALIGWLLMRGSPRQPRPAGQRDTALALALIGAGALFAYMAVGKGAPLFVVNLPLEWLGAGQHLGREATGWVFTTVHGWSTRHTFLFSAPAALMAVGLLGVWADPAGDGRTRRVWWIAMASALAVNLAWMAHGHSAKLTRLAQETAIVRALQARPPPPAGDVDIELRPAPAWNVWTYESNYWMWLAYGRAVWAVAASGSGPASEAVRRDRDEAVAGRGAGRDHYLMSEYRPGGCKTIWRVEIPGGLNGASLWLDRLGLRALPATVIQPAGPGCS